MRKLLIVGGAVASAPFLAGRARRAAGGIDFGRLVRNISEIRENTDRILQLLESQRTSAGA